MLPCHRRCTTCGGLCNACVVHAFSLFMKETGRGEILDEFYQKLLKLSADNEQRSDWTEVSFKDEKPKEENSATESVQVAQHP